MKMQQCPSCKALVKVDPNIRMALRIAGLPCRCSCGFALDLEPDSGSGKTDSQKRSRKQEKTAAKRWGGRVQPASGAGKAKGDVRVPGELRGECKLTRASSYRLRLEDLVKISKEASAGEDPVLEIEFQGVYPHLRYVVIPGDLYDYYRSLKPSS